MADDPNRYYAAGAYPYPYPYAPYYNAAAAQQQQQQQQQPAWGAYHAHPMPSQQTPPNMVAHQINGQLYLLPAHYGGYPYQQPPAFFPHQPQPVHYPAAAPNRQQPTRRDNTQGNQPKAKTGLLVRCDPCQKSFQNEKMLAAHVLQHIKCPQCDFNAAKRIVREHQTNEHGTAVKDADPSVAAQATALFKLDTPEDIERWREERRRRYPTAANVVKKRSEEELLKQSGGFQEYLAPKSAKRQKIDEKSSASNQQNNDSDDNNHDDDDGEHGAPDQMGTGFAEHDRRKEIQCKHFLRGRCKQGLKCPFKHALPPKVVSERTPSATKVEQTLRGKRQHLLRNLLQAEIYREQSIAFQAMRFCVRNDFFDAGILSDMIDDGDEESEVSEAESLSGLMECSFSEDSDTEAPLVEEEVEEGEISDA